MAYRISCFYILIVYRAINTSKRIKEVWIYIMIYENLGLRLIIQAKFNL